MFGQSVRLLCRRRIIYDLLNTELKIRRVRKHFIFLGGGGGRADSNTKLT